MQFGLDDWSLSQLTAMVKRFPQIDKVVIYGSRANGAFKNYSDIDLAIYAPSMTDEQFAAFFVAIESLPLLYKFDILRMETLRNASLHQKIETEGKTFFSKNGPQ